MAIAGLGLALMVPNVLALASLAALIIAIELQFRVVEEPYLTAVHGPTCLTYAATAGLFVSGVGRLTTAGQFRKWQERRRSLPGPVPSFGAQLNRSGSGGGSGLS
ncbi:hypothetical protein AB0D57_33540 [Streptomyces sp. NPDC048275]|uniref:hypothetical protein n=1 Tax=Streptomyces sp. NPDC048275 TaxID=3155629 RepID=UPI0033C4CA54